MTNTAVVDVNVKQPDELSFVDEDIRELFEGCSYIMGMPLMAQLIKELRLWRQARADDGRETGLAEDYALELGWAQKQDINRGKPAQQEREAAGRWLKERLGVE